MMIIVFLFVISFFEIKGLTTLHSYTFGLVFGIFSWLFYFLFFLIVLNKIYKLPLIEFKYFRLSISKLFFLSISVVFLYLVINTLVNKITSEPYSSVIWTENFNHWWAKFKNSTNINASIWLPFKYHEGLLILFIYVAFSWLLTIWAILALAIISILFLFYLIFAPDNLIPKFFTTVFWTRYYIRISLFFNKDKRQQFKLMEKEFEASKNRKYQSNSLLNNENDPEQDEINQKTNQNYKDESKDLDKDLPFDDPF
ncbi:hypothetical protein NV226_01545 [Mycoplasma iguanae]|uniref:Transmembrane protein n=1 Tax=Mycoplasma iguanae TaxID=292461 RepID=A0ABY5RCB0_9MOLU|nr:hypothetical protein [Mycoplasma iguanae]UVD81972.1 hypothetical protein NV226_01545 [Mycoplasma iguanae]